MSGERLATLAVGESTPYDRSADPASNAIGMLAFLRSVIRSGESLSDLEYKVIQDVIEGLRPLQKLPRPRLSPSALVLYQAMGEGFMMRVAHGGELAQFAPIRQADVMGTGFASRDFEAVKELVESGLVHQLTEHGEPPFGSKERARLGSWRSGWRELGLDGDVADWWVCTQ
jgi:hypothetical protein